MTMILSPAGGVIAQGVDVASGVLGVISAVGQDTFDHWEWSVSPAPPDGLVVEASGATLTAGWRSPPLGLFPLETIDYIIAGTDTQQASATRWQDVPHGVEVVRFMPSSQNARVYTINVTAHGTIMPAAGPDPAAPAPVPEPVTASGRFQIVVEHEYTANRDILKERINASRNAQG